MFFGLPWWAEQSVVSDTFRALTAGNIEQLEMVWDTSAESCEIRIDGNGVSRPGALRQSDGPCYLRLKATGEPGSGVLQVERAEASAVR